MDYLKNEVNLEELNSDIVKKHVTACVTEMKRLATECLDVLKPLTTSQSNLIPVLDLNFDHQLWEYTKALFNDLVTLFVPLEYRLQTSVVCIDVYYMYYLYKFAVITMYLKIDFVFFYVYT